MKSKQGKPKTYSLEQFRAGLQSEATARCEAQAETIRKLHERIATLESANHSLLVNEQAYKREINRLRNREIYGVQEANS